MSSSEFQEWLAYFEWKDYYERRSSASAAPKGTKSIDVLGGRGRPAVSSHD